MNKEWLEEQHSKGLSQREIAKLAGVSTPTIRNWFKKFEIQPRTISEALVIKPSKSKWTQERRAAASVKMQQSMNNDLTVSKLSKASKNNWQNNREKLIYHIRKAAQNRSIDINYNDLLSDIYNLSLDKIAAKYECSISSIRKNIRKKLGILNLREYKKLKIDIKELIDEYSTKTQTECGTKLKISSTTISRILKSHGVDTTLHFGEKFKEKISSIVKQRWLDCEYKHKMAKARASTNKISSIQLKLYSILDDLGVSYEKEYVIGPFTFDCKINNILIECNGNYWHSLPKTMSNDELKSKYINKYHPDYKLRVLWEHEFNNADRVKDLLKYWIYGTVSEIEFDIKSVTINSVESKNLKEFFGAYHYLSHCPRGGIAFDGTINNQTIIGVLFSSLIRQNLPYDTSTTMELSRLCVHPSFHKKNLCSWFVSRAIKKLPPHIKHIISYCDTTFNHTGAIYKSLNFKLDHVVRPDYWYINKEGWAIHKKTVYNRAIKNNITESEYASIHELNKIYGKEKYCFRYEI